jgi:hypothetical protein
MQNYVSFCLKIAPEGEKNFRVVRSEKKGINMRIFLREYA